MSKLDDAVYDLVAKAYCLGQDSRKGDGSAYKTDELADKAKAEIKAVLYELIGEDETGGYARGVQPIRNKYRNELRRRVKML